MKYNIHVPSKSNEQRAILSSTRTKLQLKFPNCSFTHSQTGQPETDASLRLLGSTSDNTTESTNSGQTTAAGMSAVSTANSTAVSTANSTAVSTGNSTAVSRIGDAVSSSRQEDNAVTSSSSVTVSSSPGKDKMVLSVRSYIHTFIGLAGILTKKIWIV